MYKCQPSKSFPLNMKMHYTSLTAQPETDLLKVKGTSSTFKPPRLLLSLGDKGQWRRVRYLRL